MARKTNAQLTDEVRQLRQALEDRDAELISWATYQRDFQNRWALHADEWHNLYMIDCPQYWSTLIKWMNQAKHEIFELIPTTK